MDLVRASEHRKQSVDLANAAHRKDGHHKDGQHASNAWRSCSHCLSNRNHNFNSRYLVPPLHANAAVPHPPIELLVHGGDAACDWSVQVRTPSASINATQRTMPHVLMMPYRACKNAHAKQSVSIHPHLSPYILKGRPSPVVKMSAVASCVKHRRFTGAAQASAQCATATNETWACSGGTPMCTPRTWTLRHCSQQSAVVQDVEVVQPPSARAEAVHDETIRGGDYVPCDTVPTHIA